MGIQDKETLIRSVYSYSDSQPKIVPYIEDINNSVNLDVALNKENKGRLKHIIELGKELPSWVQEVKVSFHKNSINMQTEWTGEMILLSILSTWEQRKLGKY